MKDSSNTFSSNPSYKEKLGKNSLFDTLNSTNNGVVVGRSLSVMKERIDRHNKFMNDYRKTELLYLESLIKNK